MRVFCGWRDGLAALAPRHLTLTSYPSVFLQRMKTEGCKNLPDTLSMLVQAALNEKAFLASPRETVQRMQDGPQAQEGLVMALSAAKIVLPRCCPETWRV